MATSATTSPEVSAQRHSTLRQSRFLWIPPLFLLLVFALDKVLLLPAVRDHTQLYKRIEPPFYESRYDLFEQLRLDYHARSARGESLGVIFGTSRAGEFNAADIARNRLGTYTYNFSAPFASPSFHYYWHHRIRRAGMKLRLAIIEVDPLLFSQQSVKYSLSYSYDPAFVWNNIDWSRGRLANPRDIAAVFALPGSGFSFDEAETYFLKQAFAAYKYPPSLTALRENTELNPFLGRTGNQFRDWIRSKIAEANRVNLGGIPNPLVHQASPEMIERQAAQDAATYLHDYQPAPTQVIFFRRLLRELAEQGTQVVLYWPMAPAPYRRAMVERGLVRSLGAAIEGEINRVTARNPGSSVRLVDLNDDRRMDCRFFLDSHHLSGRCYPLLTRLLLQDDVKR